MIEEFIGQDFVPAHLARRRQRFVTVEVSAPEGATDYRHLLSPETLARLEAFEAGRPMPPYPEEMNQG